MLYLPAFNWGPMIIPCEVTGEKLVCLFQQSALVAVHDRKATNRASYRRV